MLELFGWSADPTSARPVPRWRDSALLREAGFTEVVNIAGGTLAWRRQGFPVER